jgi:hypothetical protein
MHKKGDLEGSRRATLAGIQREMAKPRVAKSARKEFAHLGLTIPIAKTGKPRVADK